MHDHGGAEKQKKGISSYHMQNPEMLFAKLAIAPGSSFADIGCGAGDYTMHAAKDTGEEGRVYALDRWEELEELINEKAAESSLINIEYRLANLRKPPLPLPDNSVEQCLLANVLHGTDFSIYGAGIFSELGRILKPGGKLSIIEFGKSETSFGPPLEVRLEPQYLQQLTAPYGFSGGEICDLGCNYLLMLYLNK